MEDKLSREEVLHVADLARISLTEEEISKYHCEEIGKVLAKIHNIDLRNENNDFNEKNIDFEYYINLAKNMNSPIYEMIYDKLDILNESMEKGNSALFNRKRSCIIKVAMWFDLEVYN